MNPEKMLVHEQPFKMPERSGVQFLLAVLEVNEGIIDVSFEHDYALRRNPDFFLPIDRQKMDFCGYKGCLHRGK